MKKLLLLAHHAVSSLGWISTAWVLPAFSLLAYSLRVRTSADAAHASISALPASASATPLS